MESRSVALSSSSSSSPASLIGSIISKNSVSRILSVADTGRFARMSMVFERNARCFCLFNACNDLLMQMLLVAVNALVVVVVAVVMVLSKAP